MRKLLSLLIFFSSFNILASNLIKVAVIDTGIQFEHIKDVPLCPSGHKDLTGEGLRDINGHGTNILGLIVDRANSKTYCIILIKAYAFKKVKKSYITEALEYAYQLNVNIINLSGGGPGFSYSEYQIVKKLLNKKTTLIVAAGNDGTNFNKNCNYYPACYDDRIYVIGSYSQYSNYGQIIDSYYDGNNKTGFGITLSGTSQSTAIFTGLLLKTIAEKQKGK